MLTKLESQIAMLDRSKRRLALAFGVSFVLHLPFTPAMPMLKLVQRISGAKHAAPAPLPREIEVDLQEAVRSEEKRLQSEEVEPYSKPAGIQMEPPANVKFAKSEAKAADESQKKSEDRNKQEPKPKPAAKVKELGLEGELAKKVVGRPAVTVGLWFSSLRETPLGDELIGIATCNLDWKVLGDHGIDLLRDIDKILVVGPGLFEWAHLTVAVGHGLAAERVHGVMDALIKDSGEQGRWILPDVAAVRFGRLRRVLLPVQSDLLFVTPREGWEGLHSVKSPLRVPNAEGRVASLVLVGPNATLERVGLTLPNSISEMRVEAFANHDRSVDVKLELEAKSAEAAKKAQAEVSREVGDFLSEAWLATSTLSKIARTSPAATQREPAPRVDLEARDQTLSGTMHLSANQARGALNLLSAFVCRRRNSARGPAR